MKYSLPAVLSVFRDQGQTLNSGLKLLLIALEQRLPSQQAHPCSTLTTALPRPHRVASLQQVAQKIRVGETP